MSGSTKGCSRKPSTRLALAVDMAGLARLGRELGRSDKIHLETPLPPAPASTLSALLLLDRGELFNTTTIEPVRNAGTRVLGVAYAGFFDRRERLLRQLEVADSLDRARRVFRVRIGRGDGAATIAARIRALADAR